MIWCRRPRGARCARAVRAAASAFLSRSAGERARSRSSWARRAAAITRLRERSISRARRSAAATRSLGRVMAIRAYGMAYSILLGNTNVHMPAAVRKGSGRRPDGAGAHAAVRGGRAAIPAGWLDGVRSARGVRFRGDGGAHGSLIQLSHAQAGEADVADSQHLHGHVVEPHTPLRPPSVSPSL